MDASAELPVIISCDLLAPPQTVFGAWVTPELMRKWLFVPPGSEMADIKTDLKVEGRFSFAVKELAAARKVPYTGEYIEIRPPSSLIFSLRSPEIGEGETIVSVSIQPTNEGSVVRVTHSGLRNHEMEKRWNEMLQQLKLSLEVW